MEQKQPERTQSAFPCVVSPRDREGKKKFQKKKKISKKKKILVGLAGKIRVAGVAQNKKFFAMATYDCPYAGQTLFSYFSFF